MWTRRLDAREARGEGWSCANPDMPLGHFHATVAKGGGESHRGCPCRALMVVDEAAEGAAQIPVDPRTFAGQTSDSVEKAVVAEHAAGDRFGTGRPDLVGHGCNACICERWVARSPQPDVAVNDALRRRSCLGQGNGREPTARPKRAQKRSRREELGDRCRGVGGVGS